MQFRFGMYITDMYVCSCKLSHTPQVHTQVLCMRASTSMILHTYTCIYTSEIKKCVVLRTYRMHPSKNALARSCKKRSFFLAPLQDLARSCKILWDLAGSCGILQESCRNLARNSCKNPARFLQNPTISRKIPQDLAGSCKILQGCKKKGPFLARSCKSVFTGMFSQV